MNTNTSRWAGRRVLVTGATGFLGGAVARELFARGAEVVALVRERGAVNLFGPGQGGRVHFVQGRPDNIFRLHSAMAVHEVVTVFHLAAANPFGEDRCTAAVLEAAKLYSRRVPVVVARPAAGGPEAEVNTGLSVARFGRVFGPGDRKVSRPVPAAALALASGEPVPLPADGPATDFVYVRDAARALLSVAEEVAAGCPGEYTFNSGWKLTDREMTDAVRDLSYGARPSREGAVPNPLGWAPALTFHAALSETLEWYQSMAREGPNVARAA